MGKLSVRENSFLTRETLVRSVDLIRWETILVCKTCISLRLHIFSLPSTRLRVIYMTSTSDEMENSTTQYVVNIQRNSGTVLIGRNNVANVHSPTSSSATTLLPVDSCRAEVHLIVDTENICALGCLQQHNSSISQQTSRSTDSNRVLPISKEPTCMSKFFPVVKKRKCCHVAPSRKPRKKLNDRKRRKRNPRFSSSSSGEDVGETKIKELAFHIDGTNLEQALQYFSECITPLHPLRDNGQWDNFERVAQYLLEKKANDLHFQTIIQLEKSLVLSLQGKLEESENLINDAFKNISQMSGAIRLLLEVLSNCYLGQLNRRRKLFGNAERCLQVAKEKSARFPPSLPLTILLYEEGGYLRDFAATIQGSKKELAIGRAKEVTKRCVELCCQLDSEQKVYTRKQHIAISRMVITNLNCETRESRSKLVPKKKIQEAKKLLETLENDYFNQTETQGAKIQRLMANVDLQYRLGNLIEAKTIAEEALEIAKRLEFNLDVMPLEERLGEIHQKIIESSGSKTFREIPRINDSSSCSSKNNTPYSSEYEDKS